jgi:hypothetical protein
MFDKIHHSFLLSPGNTSTPVLDKNPRRPAPICVRRNYQFSTIPSALFQLLSRISKASCNAQAVQISDLRSQSNSHEQNSAGAMDFDKVFIWLNAEFEMRRLIQSSVSLLKPLHI